VRIRSRDQGLGRSSDALVTKSDMDEATALVMSRTLPPGACVTGPEPGHTGIVDAADSAELRSRQARCVFSACPRAST
jgi:hypothetical protein